MPFVNIRLVREVIADDPDTKKRKIARDVVESITKVTGLTPDDVWVVFEEVAAKDWVVGKQTAAERRKAAGK